MTKRVTLTQRWDKWATGSEGHPAEPFWAYSALVTTMAAFLSLGIHLCFFLPGTVRGATLVAMCIFAAISELLFILRKQWWWTAYWGSCVIGGVALFEIASYFFGGQL
jgi:hypothetical protein